MKIEILAEAESDRATFTQESIPSTGAIIGSSHGDSPMPYITR